MLFVELLMGSVNISEVWTVVLCITWLRALVVSYGLSYEHIKTKIILWIVGFFSAVIV